MVAQALAAGFPPTVQLKTAEPAPATTQRGSVGVSWQFTWHRGSVLPGVHW
jgi:hypothetical protein